MCYNFAMSEVRDGTGGQREDRNLGGLGYSREGGPLKSIRRRGIGGPGMTGPGLFDPVSEQNDRGNNLSGENQTSDIVIAPQIDMIKKTKERKRRIHPYNIPKGTKTWSGPYGKDGTMQLDDVPADVVAYPVYKKAYSGALTIMMEIESPPELKGQRFQVAKPIKGTGWYR